jgi:TPR repeat protein
MTRIRLSVPLVVAVLLGTLWADAAAQTPLDARAAFADALPTSAAEVAAVRQRAEQGDADAQDTLGFMYRFGQGVPQDDVTAEAWFHKAAEQGHRTAQYLLGVIYVSGQGVPQDYVEAAAWFRKGADQGHAGAQSRLGSLYYLGRGVPHNSAEALKWSRLAADEGDSQSQILLHSMYRYGEGVPQDYVEAHKWANLATARANGDDREQYAEFRDDLAERMPPAQLAEAQKLAREWQAAFDAR